MDPTRTLPDPMKIIPTNLDPQAHPFTDFSGFGLPPECLGDESWVDFKDTITSVDAPTGMLNDLVANDNKLTVDFSADF